MSCVICTVTKILNVLDMCVLYVVDFVEYSIQTFCDLVAFSCHAWKFCDHDDVIKWKHFPRNWPFVRGIHRSPVNSPHKGQWRGALMFPLICVLINGWVNNRQTGDLGRHCAHYDITVMIHAVHPMDYPNGLTILTCIVSWLHRYYLLQWSLNYYELLTHIIMNY